MINQAEKQTNNHSSENLQLPESNPETSSSSDSDCEDKIVPLRQITTGLTIEQDPKKIFNFLNKTSLSLTLTTSLMLFSTLFYIIDEKSFKKLFKNYCRIGNGYDYAATIFLLLSLIIPSFSYKIGRSLQIPLFLIILICYTYLPAFLLRVALKEMYNTSEFLVTVYPIFFCSALSLVIGNYFSKDRFNYKIGTTIGSGLSWVIICSYVWVFEVYDPYMWQIMLFMAGASFWAFYVNYDAFLISKWRKDCFRPNDWFLGMTHLQTDIFFRFWYYMVLEAFDNEVKVEQDYEDNDKHTEMIIAIEK